MSQWLLERTTRVLDGDEDAPPRGPTRRSFLTKVAVVGSAVVLAPLRYILRPGTAYAVVCGDCGGGACCDGYTEFCCVLNGNNVCPPGTFSGGWWKADGSAYCNSQARYYVDCHAECTHCGCANGSAFCGQSCVDCRCGCQSCANRKNCCTNFRYGQCNQQIPCVGPIACRVATCSPPYVWDSTCTSVSATDQNTVTHTAACLTQEPAVWRGYEPLGGVLSSSPAVASWDAGRLDVFVRGNDNQIYRKVFNGSTWLPWDLMGQPTAIGGQVGVISGPAAVSRAFNRIDLFVRGPLNQLWHKWWDGRRWQGWTSRGGNLGGAPAAASWGSDRIDVFARGVTGDLIHASADGANNWTEWESLGGVMQGRPGAVSWGQDRIDVFVHGSDNAMWHRWYDQGWSNWEGLGGVLIGGPDAASTRAGRLDVFVRGTDDALWQKSWDGVQWSGWTTHGGTLRDEPAAVSWGPDRLDVFVRGTDDELWHRWRT
jgi:hypothetical protein